MDTKLDSLLKRMKQLEDELLVEIHAKEQQFRYETRHLRTLEYLLNGGNDPRSLEAKLAVSQLKDAMRSLSRIVEFNIEDSYFEWRAVELV